MDNYKQDLIYNKKPYEYNKKDANYLRELIHRDDLNNIIKKSILFVPVAVMAATLLVFFALKLPLYFVISTGVLQWMAITLGCVGVCLAKRPSLKDLGLSKKDWKGLKKNKLRQLRTYLHQYEKGEENAPQEYLVDSIKNNGLKKVKQKMLELQTNVETTQEQINKETNKNEDSRTM